VTDELLGIIAPHPPIMVDEVGGARAEVTSASGEAMRMAAELLARFNPQTVVLMSPHAPVVRDAFLVDDSERLTGDLGGFGAPQVRLSVSGDPELARAIVEEAQAEGIPVFPRSESSSLQAGLLDHGVLVPMSFLDRRGRYPLLVLSLSFLPLEVHRAFGLAIRRAIERTGRRVAFVASGDCSHRLAPDAPAGYTPRAKDFDAQLVRLLSHGDFQGLTQIDPDLVEAAGECGLRSFITLGGVLEDGQHETKVLSYEGPWGVGYLTAVAGEPALVANATAVAGTKGGHAGDSESEPVALARATIETYVREHRVVLPPPAEGLFGERHGAFVSLHLDGALRGCIGTIVPTQPSLAEEIVHNAIQAATADPRFSPLRPDELDRLEISVDVLQAPEPADLEDLDPSAYGVIVSCGYRRGLLLPDLEGVDTVEDQVSIACQKAGIGPHETVQLERFCVDRYH
jgi:AmmeMemoRadiSam system protein A